MGNTGSLALGGGLAAMACCTGMFFPLFISSGVFVLEASSVILQVMYFKTTKRLQGAGRRLFRMAPFHNHLELCGLKELVIGLRYKGFFLSLAESFSLFSEGHLRLSDAFSVSHSHI